MSPYLIWVPLLIAIHLTACKLSVMNQGGNNWAAIWMMVIGIIPIWIVVSRFSKNILFDAMLYDVLMMSVYTLGIAYFSDKILTPLNYMGIALMFLEYF